MQGRQTGAMSPPKSALLLLAAMAPALAGCDLHACGNQVLRTVTAPDGRHAAAIFRRDCGATTGFSIQVSLVGPGEAPAGSGDLFVAGGEGRMPDVEWLGPDPLRISYRRDSLLLHEQVSERDGVRIEYRMVGISALSPASCHRNPN